MRDVIDLERLRTLGPNEAAALLSARVNDPSGPHDFDLLDDWLALDDANKSAWGGVQGTLGLFAACAADEEFIAQLRAGRPLETQRSWSPVKWGMAAACAAVFVAGSYMLWDFPGGRSVDIAASAPERQIYTAAVDQIRDVALPDGSKLILQSGATVETAFSADRRALKLVRGRARFEVDHDKTRPFVVSADGHDVVALGTKFDVALDAKRFEVSLFEGRVSVNASANWVKPVILLPGQRLLQEKGHAPQIVAVTPSPTTFAQIGKVTFRDEPLAKVVTELNLYSTEQLVLNDPQIASLRISGTFRTGDVAPFGRSLAAIYPVRIVRRGDGNWDIISTSSKKVREP